MPDQHKTHVVWHRNPRVRAIIFQVLAIVVIARVAYDIANNTVANMAERGIIVGLDFMGQVAPFEIGYTPFWDYVLGESKYWEVLVVGVQNSLLVSVLGVISATLLGFLIGILRLSPNWLVAKLAGMYVEIFRNIPLPLWIFFWGFSVFLKILPAPSESYSFGGGLFLNKEGLYTPKPIIENGVTAGIFAALFVALIVGLVLFSRWAKRRQDDTGEILPLMRINLGLLVLTPIVLFYILGRPFSLEYAEMGRFTLQGGINLSLPLFTMWFALTTYTASYIGESVRAGILAVSHGQSEAAYSLGIRRMPVLRMIVIPQAMRVIIPPTISQFLNLTKNSSLAVIVAYEDIVAVFAGIALNQTGQALPIIAITMGFYATASLLTSAILNWYNKRVQLTER